MKIHIMPIAILSMAILLSSFNSPAAQPLSEPGEISIQASIGTTFVYQGFLHYGASPANGPFSFRFYLYNDPAAGTVVGEPVLMDNLQVANGVFAVPLDFGGVIVGQELWLETQVRLGGAMDGYTILTPRQPLAAAPVALTLRPGARIIGNIPEGPSPDQSAALAVINTNDVLNRAHGIYVQTNAIESSVIQPAAILAHAMDCQAVRGEAGDVSDIGYPLGEVGVVGRGANRGIYGSSNVGVGLFGLSEDNYGLWGQSTAYRGVTGRTSREDNDYGLFTFDNLYSLNFNGAGAIMLVARNGGTEAIEPGEVAALGGMSEALHQGGPPVAAVVRATAENAEAVIGVVQSRFDIAAVDESIDNPDDGSAQAAIDPTPPGAVQPGEHLLLVVKGPAKVKASAVNGAVQPGARLTVNSQASGQAARSMKSSTSAIIGKAMEPLTDGVGDVWVFVNVP